MIQLAVMHVDVPGCGGTVVAGCVVGGSVGGAVGAGSVGGDVTSTGGAANTGESLEAVDAPATVVAPSTDPVSLPPPHPAIATAIATDPTTPSFRTILEP
jgi:hypothetical protein